MSGASLLMGVAGVGYSLPTAGADASAGIDAVVTLNMNSAGTFSCVGNTLGTTQSGNWLSPTALAPGSYTIRLGVNSGTTPSGAAVDTDLALTSNRVWTWTQVGVGTTSANCTLTLKDGGGNVVATATYTVTATRSI